MVFFSAGTADYEQVKQAFPLIYVRKCLPGYDVTREPSSRSGLNGRIAIHPFNNPSFRKEYQSLTASVRENRRELL